MSHTQTAPPAWQQAVFEVLKKGQVEQVAYVPDAGHSFAIREATVHRVDEPDRVEDVVEAALDQAFEANERVAVPGWARPPTTSSPPVTVAATSTSGARWARRFRSRWVWPWANPIGRCWRSPVTANI